MCLCGVAPAQDAREGRLGRVNRGIFEQYLEKQSGHVSSIEQYQQNNQHSR